tara:strand:- start:736 stop:1104 length:369 start_codon:yes stop_codon:yes gene_type:complete
MALDFDIKNSEALLNNLVGLMSVDVNTNTNKVPMPVILVNGPLKQGLSAKEIASEIISRQSEALEQQDNILEAGGVSEAMEIIRVEEIVKAIQTKMRVDVGTLPSANGGGPIPPIQGYGQAY